MSGKEYKGLVISSGGYKGYGILGALSELEKRGRLSFGIGGFTSQYAGTSVGAVLSVLLAVGWRPAELIEEAIQIKIFKGLGDVDIKMFKEKHGIMSNESLKEDLTRLVKMKWGSVPTMMELYDAGLYVAISITDRLTKTGHCIDWRSDPNLLCTDAAMMSSNIPFVFAPIDYNGMKVIDGAFINPFPLNYLDNGEDDILGICVYGNTGDDMNNIFAYSAGMIMILIEQMQRDMSFHSSAACDVLEMNCGDLNVLSTDDAIEQKLAMYTIGHEDGRALDRALRGIKNDSPTVTKVKIRKFDKDLLESCLSSMPLDYICESAKNSPAELRSVIKKMPKAKRVRIETFLNLFGEPAPPPKFIPKKPENLHIKEVFDTLPIHIKQVVTSTMMTIPPELMRSTISGLDSILGGIKLISMGKKINRDRGRVQVMDDEEEEILRIGGVN